MTITADLIRTWSQALCTQPALDLPGALRALGLSGALVEKSSDFSVVEPAPAGTSRVGLTLENLGQNKGHLGTVEVALAGAVVTRGELDQRLGAGTALPIADVGRDEEISYQVTVPGAAYRCTVFAGFAEEPAAATAATKITLRRDVVRAP